MLTIAHRPAYFLKVCRDMKGRALMMRACHQAQAQRRASDGRRCCGNSLRITLTATAGHIGSATVPVRRSGRIFRVRGSKSRNEGEGAGSYNILWF